MIRNLVFKSVVALALTSTQAFAAEKNEVPSAPIAIPAPPEGMGKLYSFDLAAWALPLVVPSTRRDRGLAP